MISIKEHLYANRKAQSPHGRLPTDASIAAYRSAILAMGKAGIQATPNLGVALQRNLSELEHKLAADSSERRVLEVDRSVTAELSDWGSRASAYFYQKTAEVKEILLMLTHSAHAASERDERYGREFESLSEQLETISHLDDLTSIRQSLALRATELKVCAEKMMEDGRKTVAQLRSELAVYQSRLAESESLASRDALTGLDNRRSLEARIEERLSRLKTFCIILFDLNDFKQVNDLYGHAAGDRLLQQFASELQNQFQSGGTAGRWGGDEFLVISDSGSEEAQSKLQRSAEWLLGDYRIKLPDKTISVRVSAAAGLAEWNRKESLNDLVNRADADMYARKEGKNTRRAYTR